MRYLVLLFILSPLLSFSQQIFVPNAFTPNNDGINDYFGVSISGDSLTNYELTIWNTNGNQVFKTNNLKDKWLGGIEYYPASNLFVYRIQYKFLSGEASSKTGTIYLIR